MVRALSAATILVLLPLASLAPAQDPDPERSRSTAVPSGHPGPSELSGPSPSEGASGKATRGGISWPAGQALPTFATPSPVLDAIEVQALSPDERITFSSLQGQVNRTRPRILLLDARADQGRDTWAETPTVGLGRRRLHRRSERYHLLARYAEEVEGVVLYDPSRSAHHRNLAGTVAGLLRALPVTTDVQRRLEENGVRLPVLEDLTSLELSSPVEIYEHLHARYWPRCEKRLIVSARPDTRGGDLHHTRDVAAACGAAVVWLDNRVDEERRVMRKFLGDMKAGDAVVLGWYTSERSGITTATEFGIGTLPADHYLSASVHAGVDHRIRIPAVPKRPTLRNRAYIAIFISDGDNIQYTQRALRRIWDRSSDSRGRIPLNWTIAPGLVDIGPGILNYYYTTATPMDCFVAGPSGMGYLMPCNTLEEPGAPVGVHLRDAGRMDGYARMTETYLERSGLRVVTIWDDATPMQRASYERICRNLYGATVQNFRDVPSVAGSVEGGRLRFERLVVPYASTYEHARRSLERELRRWDGKAPLFLALQVSVWGEMKPDRIVDLAERIRSRFPDRVEFVRADHYFNLQGEARGIPHNLVLRRETSVRASEGSGSPELATDGTPATVWTSSAPGSRWLSLDLGARHDLRRLVVRHAGAGGAGPDRNTRGFTLEVSVDGAAWRVVHRVRDNREDVTDVDLPPVAARHVRLTVDDAGADSTARIADLEVFGVRVTPAAEPGADRQRQAGGGLRHPMSRSLSSRDGPQAGKGAAGGNLPAKP